MAKALKINKEKVKKAGKKAAVVAAVNWQPILIGAAVLVGGVLIYKTVKGISNVADQFGVDPEVGGGNPSTTGGNTIPNNGTITRNLASTKAAALFNAMRYPGTDETKILNILNGMTPTDYALISQEFGNPKYNTTMGIYMPYGFWPALNITEWLHEELNENNLQELRLIMPGVL